jgi:hypothetical protein
MCVNVFFGKSNKHYKGSRQYQSLVSVVSISVNFNSQAFVSAVTSKEIGQNLDELLCADLLSSYQIISKKPTRCNQVILLTLL